MLGTCNNGHLTGQRRCGTCGSDRTKYLGSPRVAPDVIYEITESGPFEKLLFIDIRAAITEGDKQDRLKRNRTQRRLHRQRQNARRVEYLRGVLARRKGIEL